MSIEKHMHLSLAEEDHALEPYTVQELRERLAKSEREYDEGEFYTQKEAHQLMEQFVQQKIETA